MTRTPVDASSIIAVLALGAHGGDTVTIAADGDGADAALDALAELLARDLDAETEAAVPELTGLGVSPGRTAGPVYRMCPAAELPAEVARGDRRGRGEGRRRPRRCGSSPTS